MTTLEGQSLAEARAAATELRKRTWVHLRHPEDHIPLFEVPNTVSDPVPKPMLMVVFAWAALVAVIGMWLEKIGTTATIPLVPGLWTAPFAILLGCIAIMPFAAKHFWERHYHHVALALGLIVAGYYAFGIHATANLAKTCSEYISFIFLLASLFVVSGGILFRVRQRATPGLNSFMLLAGAVLANVFGTTGASVLMIRPFIKLNHGHMKPYQVVFFIFAVSNVGGALTPIGDPPLFLGYLKGVPFWWVLQKCWPVWLLAIGLLLAIFFVLDLRASRKEPRGMPDPADVGPAVSLWGASNLLWISLILTAVFLPAPYREILMAAAACGSLWTTPRRIHVENHFNYAPIKEVSLLFIGIFLTMVPALDYLYANAQKDGLRQLLSSPGQYYFMTGALSSVLDNAPTYLTFLESELGKNDPVLVERARAIIQNKHKLVPDGSDFADLTNGQKSQLTHAFDALRRYHSQELANSSVSKDQLEVSFLLNHPGLVAYLMAISLGAVFFGACTYIGNGPNFMVKSIAEHDGVKCPSFFGYIGCYTLPVLLPIFVLCWFLFLR